MISFIDQLNFWDSRYHFQKGWTYKPDGISEGKPCVIWFAGRGEAADINKIATASTVPADITRGWKPDFTVFTFTGNGSGVYQQASSQTGAQYWGNILRYVLDVLKADPNRIYLAGLSGGGFACFEWITTSRELCEAVAAILPASPMAGTWQSRLATSTWLDTVHCWGGAGTGSGDASFLNNLRQATAAIQNAGGDAQITEYAGAGHSGAVWEPFYAPESPRWPWLLSWARNAAAPPTVVSKYELAAMSDGTVQYTKLAGQDLDLTAFPKQL